MKKNKGTREFKGPLFPRDEKIHETTDLDIREYINMQKKHLHAYLNGDTRFRYKGVWYNVESNFVDNV